MPNEAAKQEEKKELTLSGYIVEELTRIDNALPKDFNKSRFAQNAVALLQENPKLIKDYGQAQVVAGLLKGATLGLDFYAKECYLIPYGNQLQFQMDYKGKMKVAKRYSRRPIKDIQAKIVREDDILDITDDTGKGTFVYKPIPFSKKQILGVFAYIIYEDGTSDYDLVSLEELEVIRSKSKMGKCGAWKDFTNEMYKKCAINRLCKTIDLDFENVQQKDTFFEDTAIETDVEKVVENEVKENANSKSFDIEIDTTESE